MLIISFEQLTFLLYNFLMIPKRIVAIGSSSLYGRVDPEGGGYVGRLRKWHENNGVHNAVFNLGIGGDTTTCILKRLSAEASIRKPDLILFTTGLNDTRRIGQKDAPVTTPLAQFQKNVQGIIQESKKFAEIVVMGVYPIDDTRTQPLVETNFFYLMTDAKQYEQETREICRVKNIPYLNIWDTWMKTDYKPWLYADGLHANSLGHEQIFEVLKRFLISHF